MKNKSQLNSLMIAGVLLNFIGVIQILFLIDNIGFALVWFVFWLISLFGLVLCALKVKNYGPICVMIGSILFVPLGLIALIGARKVLDDLTRSNFS